MSDIEIKVWNSRIPSLKGTGSNQLFTKRIVKFSGTLQNDVHLEEAMSPQFSAKYMQGLCLMGNIVNQLGPAGLVMHITCTLSWHLQNREAYNRNFLIWTRPLVTMAFVQKKLEYVRNGHTKTHAWLRELIAMTENDHGGML